MAGSVMGSIMHLLLLHVMCFAARKLLMLLLLLLLWSLRRKRVSFVMLLRRSSTNTILALQLHIGLSICWIYKRL